MMIENHYILLIVSLSLTCSGMSLIFPAYCNATARFFGMVAILTAGIIVGVVAGSRHIGVPANIDSIARFQELQIIKRLDRSLSIVKSIEDNDERIVKDVPEHVLMGEVFMVNADGTVIVLKKTAPPVNDGQE